MLFIAFYCPSANSFGFLISGVLHSMADLFKQQRFSDADLLIKVDNNDAEVCIDLQEHEIASGGGAIKLPVHRLALVHSEFFDTQVSFQERSGSADAAARPLLEVTVDHAAHVPVMEGVIHCMYLDSSNEASAFKGFSQQQLVLAVKYADMIQFKPAIEHASRLLTEAVVSGGLHALALDALCELGDLPHPLIAALPEFITAAGNGNTKVKQLFLSTMADLERVWEQPQLKEVLMRLPLTAMELLMSSDQLKASSEDTVMYTAGEYVCSLPASEQAAAADRLGCLIRCQHLSSFQLMAQAVNTDTTAFNVLKQYQSLLRLLMTMRRVPTSVLQTEVRNALRKVWQKGSGAKPKSAGAKRKSAGAEQASSNDAVNAAFKAIDAASSKMAAGGLPPGAPESWSLPARNYSGVVIDQVDLVWQVDVDSIKQLYQSCVDDVQQPPIDSPDPSPPLSGLSWKLSLACNKKEGGVEIGLFLKQHRGPSSVAVRYHMMLQGAGINKESDAVRYSQERGWGWNDFFDTGRMHGDFLKSAWVTKNLPVSGVIELRATVSQVN